MFGLACSLVEIKSNLSSTEWISSDNENNKDPRYVGRYPISHPLSALDQRPGRTITIWSFIKINEPAEI